MKLLGAQPRHCRVMIWPVLLLLAQGAAGQDEQIPNLFEMFPSKPAVQQATADGRDDAAELAAGNRNVAGGATVADSASDEAPVAGDQTGEPPVDGASDVFDTIDALPESIQDQPLEFEAANGARQPVADDEFPNQARGQDEGEERELKVAYRHLHVIKVDGPIFSKFAWFLNQRLEAAKKLDVDLVLVELTSPGGDMEASIELARKLRDIQWATVCVWIPDQAISGGAIVSLGADHIYMKSGALIGDAGPVQLGLDGQFRHAEEKVVSYLSEVLNDLANSQGRPGALAQAMSDRTLVVYEARDRQSGERKFLTESETQNPELQARYVIGEPVPETGQNRFLTLGATRATELDLVDGEFRSEDELFASITYEKLSRTEYSWVDGVVFFLNRPLISALLLIVGLVGLYFELLAPGISVAGLTAASSFTIFFWSHALGGTSGWLEVSLFVLGVLCLICELFLVPGFGVFGISGLALVLFSLVMASQDFVLPQGPKEWNVFQSNVTYVLGAILVFTLLFFFQVFILDSIPGLNRFRLAAPVPEIDFPVHELEPVDQSGSGPFPFEEGMEGVAESDLRPSGKAVFQDRLVDVLTEGDYIEANTPVRIVKVEGKRVTVRKT